MRLGRSLALPAGGSRLGRSLALPTPDRLIGLA
jgi:hypothetical protein